MHTLGGVLEEESCLVIALLEHWACTLTKKRKKNVLTLNTRTFRHVVNLIKFRMQLVIECPRHFELLHSKRIIVNRFTLICFFFTKGYLLMYIQKRKKGQSAFFLLHFKI